MPQPLRISHLAGQSFSFCFIEVLGEPFQLGQDALLNTPAKPPHCFLYTRLKDDLIHRSPFESKPQRHFLSWDCFAATVKAGQRTA